MLVWVLIFYTGGGKSFVLDNIKSQADAQGAANAILADIKKFANYNPRYFIFSVNKAPLQ